MARLGAPAAPDALECPGRKPLHRRSGGPFHLPLFFQPGSDQAANGLPVFVIGSVAGAIVFSWVFNNTLGSLLLVQLFHIFANTWITLFPAAPADNVASQWLFNGLLVVIAAMVLVASGPRRLSRKPASELPVVSEPPSAIITA